MRQDLIERRKFGRRQTFKSATLLDEADVRHDGIVIDLSEGGARIRLANPHAAPPVFMLLIPADDFCVACRLVHVRDDSIGVEFTSSPRRISWGKPSRRQVCKTPQDV